MAGRGSPRFTRARVQHVEWLTPHMIRVVLGGPGLAGFTAGSHTDEYIKMLFPVEGAAFALEAQRHATPPLASTVPGPGSSAWERVGS